jgi:hypothetical protein
MQLIFSALTLIIANLLGIYIAIETSPSIVTLWLVYWIENISIGFFTVLKMKMLIKLGKESILENNKQDIIFFIIHYGGFTFLHGLFLIIFAIALESHLISLITIGINAILLFVSHGISYWRNFIKAEEYNFLTIDSLFIRPYPRIVATQIMILVGSYFVWGLKNQAFGIILLGVCKLGADLISHLVEHRKQFKRIQ